jgi:hypothetical protein
MIMRGIMHSSNRYDVKHVAQPTSGGLGFLSGATWVHKVACQGVMHT